MVQRVGDFYASGMDEAAIDREGLRPLKPWLNRIQAIATPKELIAVIALLQTQGLNVGFHFDVQIDDKDTTAMIAGFSQGGLGLPERDYYFREGKDAEEIRAAYVAHIARMFELAGDAPAPAKAAADVDHGLGNQAGKGLADARGSARSGEELQQVQRTALAKLAPGLDWNGYFATIAFPTAKPRCWFASRSFSRPSVVCSPPSRWPSGAITCAGI